MPFGKHLLTSAVEGESKQSCVIFSFYFMSLAATVNDGCGSLVFFFMLCIILIIFMSIGILPLHMYLYFTFIALSSLERANLLQKYKYFLEYVSVFIIFCLQFPKNKL